MDGLIGVSSRRTNHYTRNLGIQKLGIKPTQFLARPEVVGYYESSMSTATILGTGSTSPPMNLRANDVVYVIGCEGNIGTTTASTAATTFTGQGAFGGVWTPTLYNSRTGIQTGASHREVAMLNARQNQWSTGTFQSTPTNDWASVLTGQTAVLGTYRSFLSLRILIVPETGQYNIFTGGGPRGAVSGARHVYCIAFRGVNISRLSTLYYEPVAGNTQFIKSPRSRISTGIFTVGFTSANRIDVFTDFNPYLIGLQGQTQAQSLTDRSIIVGMIPELDLVSDVTSSVKSQSNYKGWIGSLWSDQYDGSGGLSSMCGLDSAIFPTLNYTYNHSGVLAITPSLVISTCYEITVPSL